MPLRELVPILQIAIGPVILISGIGLLLLSMTNQFGRVADRTRQLLLALRSAKGAEQQVALAQIEILSARASSLKMAITLSAVSLLFTAVLVITLFLAAVLHWEVGILVLALFICCMGSLIAGLVTFLRDIHLSVAALKLEVAAKHEYTS